MLLLYIAMLITVLLLLDDIKELNLYKVGHDIFLKYLYILDDIILILLYLIAHLAMARISTYIIYNRYITFFSFVALF